MWFPWAKTHPTKLRLARIVSADHVIAPATLLNSGPALGTFLIGANTVTRNKEDLLTGKRTQHQHTERGKQEGKTHFCVDINPI